MKNMRSGDGEEMMIQFRLKELMARKERLEDHRITYAVITAQTRISPSTLSRMANNGLDLVALSVVDRLCAFFPCTAGDLIVYVADRADLMERDNVTEAN
jgi:putative transcriptional regulator